MRCDFICAWFKDRRGLLDRHGEQIALGLLIAFVSLVNLIWILQDTRPQPGADPNHYLLKTFEFIDGLKEQGSARWWQSVGGMSIGGGRPPLYQLLAVPFIYLFGRSEDAALVVNVVFQALLLLFTYGIGRLAKNGKAGLLAALLVATYPPIVNSSKIFLPHSATPACVALSLWLLLLLLKTRSARIAWLFGVSLALGMWIQFQFLYLLPALAIVGLYMLLFQVNPRRPSNLKGTPLWLLRKLGDPFALYGLLSAALIAAGLTAAWYLPHSQAILGLRQGVAVDFGGVTEGFGAVPHSFWWYALTAPGAISRIFAALLAIGLVFGVLKPRSGLSVLVITFVITYTGFGLSKQVLGWIYFAALLPVAAALTAVWVVDLCTAGVRRIRLLATALVVVCVVVAAFNFAIVTWGMESWGWPIATALGAPLDPPSCLNWRMHVAYCPNPARDEDWHVSDILQIILDDPECQERECHLVVVPYREDFNLEIFNSHLLRDFQARERIRTSNPAGWRGQPGNGEWVTSDYLVYIPHVRQGSYGAETTIAITQFLESPSPGFAAVYREVAAFTLPWGWTAKLIKRFEPLAIDTTIQLYEEALANVPSDVALYEKLGYLYLRIGTWSRAEELFRQATQIDPALGSPHLALGYLYQSQGLDDRAIEAFQEAVEKQLFEPKAYRQLADLWAARGDLQGAVRVYELAARNNPRLVWPYLELGALYVQSNRLAEARAAYQEAARLEPWNQTAQANLQSVHWSLASGLGIARAYADQTPLIWWQGEAWVKPYPYNQDVLVGRSVLSAAGLGRPDQIHLHPFGADQDTYVDFDIQDCRYAALQVGYGLADQVADLSNGVRYTLRASVDRGSSYTGLWDATVTDSVWRSQTLSLVPYWGEDLTLQLAVDALGDERYDWLQTTARLFPAAQAWDLAANLATVQVAAMELPLAWDGASAWVDGNGRPLVTISQASVQGTVRDNQVQFHPFSSQQDTAINLVVEDNPYSMLKTAYALADEVIGRSDGVDYTIVISTNGGRTHTSLLQREVLNNTWDSATLDLSAYLGRDLTIKLSSASRGNENYDWLQITASLIEIDDSVRNRGE